MQRAKAPLDDSQELQAKLEVKSQKAAKTAISAEKATGAKQIALIGRQTQHEAQVSTLDQRLNLLLGGECSTVLKVHCLGAKVWSLYSADEKEKTIFPRELRNCGGRRRESSQCLKSTKVSNKSEKFGRWITEKPKQVPQGWLATRVHWPHLLPSPVNTTSCMLQENKTKREGPRQLMRSGGLQGYGTECWQGFQVSLSCWKSGLYGLAAAGLIMVVCGRIRTFISHGRQ